MPKPKINSDTCLGKSCNICVEVCPMDVFSKDEQGKSFVEKENECIGCNACEAQCPSHSIKMLEE